MLRDLFKSQKNNPSYYEYPNYQRPSGKKIRNFLDGKLDLGIEDVFRSYVDDIRIDNDQVEWALGIGSNVVRNRWPNSTLAYQTTNMTGLGKIDYKVAKRELKRTQKLADLVVYLDVTAEEAHRRKHGDNERLDKFESNMSYLNGVIGSYKRICRDAPLGKTYKIVDCMQSAEKVHEDIKCEVSKKLAALA